MRQKSEHADRKYPVIVFKARENTLEKSTIFWSSINEINRDIRQCEQETTDKLDMRITTMLSNCRYTEQETETRKIELLFHTTKHFKVKKWVKGKKREDLEYRGLHKYMYQVAQEHSKDF